MESNPTQDTLMRQFALLSIPDRITVLKADVDKLQLLTDSAKAKLKIEEDIASALDNIDEKGDS